MREVEVIRQRMLASKTQDTIDKNNFHTDFDINSDSVTCISGQLASDSSTSFLFVQNKNLEEVGSSCYTLCTWFFVSLSGFDVRVCFCLFLGCKGQLSGDLVNQFKSLT